MPIYFRITTTFYTSYDQPDEDECFVEITEESTRCCKMLLENGCTTYYADQSYNRLRFRNKLKIEMVSSEPTADRICVFKIDEIIKLLKDYNTRGYYMKALRVDKCQLFSRLVVEEVEETDSEEESSEEEEESSDDYDKCDHGE